MRIIHGVDVKRNIGVKEMRWERTDGERTYLTEEKHSIRRQS